jgi:hypothetical protein
MPTTSRPAGTRRSCSRRRSHVGPVGLWRRAASQASCLAVAVRPIPRTVGPGRRARSPAAADSLPRYLPCARVQAQASAATAVPHLAAGPKAARGRSARLACAATNSASSRAFSSSRARSSAAIVRRSSVAARARATSSAIAGSCRAETSGAVRDRLSRRGNGSPSGLSSALRSRPLSPASFGQGVPGYGKSSLRPAGDSVGPACAPALCSASEPCPRCEQA